MSAANCRKKGWVITAVWLLVPLGMLLAPAPREWGVFGKWISPYYDRVQSVIQPAAHVLLMAVCSILFIRGFAHRTIMVAVLYSFGLAVVFAATLEMLQSILPSGFARRCDVGDLIPSVIGATVGCIIGILFRVRREKPC